MSVINTNIKATIAQNAMTVNNRAMSSAMQELSTGKRINSASDDAAGLAIAAKMTSQIKGLDQAVRNGNDGISLLQTAEGAMVEMTNMLQRMREVSVQSSSDTNTVSDRTNLDAEFQQLKSEITRIGANTQWNGVNILNGNTAFGTTSGNNQNVKFQVGANANQTIDIDFKNYTFTPSASAATKSVTQINLGTHVAGTDAQRFKGTFGGVAVDVTLAAAMSAAPTTAEATAMAADLQTKMRAYSGLEGVSVTSVGSVLTINDPTGKAASGIDMFKLDGTAATTTTLGITYSNGAAGAGTAPVGGVFSSTLAGTSLTTQTNANAATGEMDTAIAAINTERSKIGATINRLNYAVDNLTNISQNTKESRSRIEDTDYAKATTELARTQIIQQAATAMLAQANQSSQSVLSLLK